MGVLETAAMWAAVLSGTVTVASATTALVLVGSRRARRGVLVKLGIPALRSHVATVTERQGEITDRQEDILDHLESELAAAADARQTYAAQILALAYAIESDEEVSLDVAEFARGQAARSDGEPRVSDFLEGPEEHDLLRGSDAAGGG